MEEPTGVEAPVTVSLWLARARVSRAEIESVADSVELETDDPGEIESLYAELEALLSGPATTASEAASQDLLVRLLSLRTKRSVTLN